MLDDVSEETFKMVVGLIAACVAIIIIGVVALDKDEVYIRDWIRLMLRSP